MAKKVVKPTSVEQKIIDRRLKEKYPHMFTENWVSRLKKDVQKELKKQKSEQTQLKTKRTKQVSDQLRKSGLTEKEIARLRGKK